MPRTREIDVSRPVVLVVMGVSGSGKSTIAEGLAERLGWRFEEGDELHPEANKKKMAAGHPLDDDDRWPWLERIESWIDDRLDAGESGIVTCSALKRAYRDVLDRRGENVGFVLLNGSREQIEERLHRRKGHFMPSSLLDSQFATLECPTDDEAAVEVDIAGTPDDIVDRIVGDLHLETAPASD